MSIESVKIESVMTKGVKTINELQSVKAVASAMSAHNIGSLIITEDEDIPVGIITETDIVRTVGVTEAFLPHLLARDIMSKPVITIDASRSIQDAIQSMKLNNIRRLLVVDREGRLVGIITDKDIFKAIINSQSLIAGISENVTIEYKPIYESLSQFMVEEILLPGGRNPS